MPKSSECAGEFYVHRDYLNNARDRAVCEALVVYLRESDSRGDLFFAFSGEVDAWWCGRHQTRGKAGTIVADDRQECGVVHFGIHRPAAAG